MATMGVVAHDITIGSTSLAWNGEAPYLKWAVHYTVNVSDIITALCALTPGQAALPDATAKGRGLRTPQTVDAKSAGSPQVIPQFYKEANKEYEENVGRANQDPSLLKGAACTGQGNVGVAVAKQQQQQLEVGQWNSVSDADFVSIAQGIEWEELASATKTKSVTMAVMKKKQTPPKPAQAKSNSKTAKSTPPRPKEAPPAAPAAPVTTVPSAGRVKAPPPKGPAPAPPQQESQAMAAAMMTPQVAAVAASPAPPAMPPPPPPLQGSASAGPPQTFGKGASPAATAQAKAVGEKQLECKTQ